jgi:hypothetical protein
MHKVEEITQYLQGWSSPQKCMLLYSLVVTHKIKTSVEIGVFGGKGSVSMSCGHKEVGGVCYGVDPYDAKYSIEDEKIQVNVDWWQNVDYEKLYRDLMIFSLAHGLTKELQILRMTSELASTIFQKESIGLVVVDGNHNFPQVSKDFELWLPKVYPGGFLLADDLLGWGVPEAIKMVEHYGFKEVEIVDDPAGSRWGLYQKITTLNPE